MASSKNTRDSDRKSSRTPPTASTSKDTTTHHHAIGYELSKLNLSHSAQAEPERQSSVELGSNSGSCTSSSMSLGPAEGFSPPSHRDQHHGGAIPRVKTESGAASNRHREDPVYDNVPESVHQLAAVPHRSPPNNSIISLDEIPNTSLEIGSCVEVTSDIYDGLYGIIQYIGFPPHADGMLVGVELENRMPDIPMDVTDGVFKKTRLFTCQPGRGIFVRPAQVLADSRFADHVHEQYSGEGSPVVKGVIAPLNIMTYGELDNICGMYKGIQGNHNSCYLDATLFAMFAFTNVFDAVLYREPEGKDIPQYNTIRKLLEEEIVNPLRVNKFVRATSVMKLRTLLENLCSVKGLTSEEKDPEEFLNILMVETLKAEPLLKLNTGHTAFCHQLFVDKDESLHFPTVQQLFDQSFTASSIKLKEVPRCLIVQMPRFGKNFKMYPRILPTQVLDVTDVIENDPRQCTVCGNVAELECTPCFKLVREEISFCTECYLMKKEHKSREHGEPTPLNVPDEFTHQCRLPRKVPRVYMNLFAVVCIETSHYVSFVKTGDGETAPWCFFDSMSNREGGQNVPELQTVPELPYWLSETGSKIVNDEAASDRQLPHLAKRLLCDAYLCMYQCKDSSKFN